MHYESKSYRNKKFAGLVAFYWDCSDNRYFAKRVLRNRYYGQKLSIQGFSVYK